VGRLIQLCPTVSQGQEAAKNRAPQELPQG
jgi:hypothetical protein